MQRLVDDLADDPYDYNAVRALWRLPRYGEAALPALRHALDSDDWQQRQLAAHLLRTMDDQPPGEAMLRVCVEALRRDDLPSQRRTPDRFGEPGRWMPVANAVSSVTFLLEHVETAEARLVAALESEEFQQRFLSAFVLGTAGRSQHTGRISQILVPHLGDNDIRQDALMAGSALYRLGPTVAPFLEAAKNQADPQAKAVINLILLDLRDPPDTPQKLRSRSGRVRLSTLYHDPIYEYRFPRGGFSGIGGWDR